MSVPTRAPAAHGARPPAPPQAARAPGATGSRILATAALVSRAAAVVLVVAAVVAGLTGLSWTVVETPLVVLALVASLPHGAADAAAPWLRGRRLAAASYAALGAAYLGVAALVWLLCSTWPPFGLLLLLAASVAHFGSGETTFHELRGARVGRWYALPTGLVVVALPLVAHPVQVGRYLAVMVPGWDGLLPVPLGVVLTAAILLGAGLAAGHALSRGRLDAAGDLALLAVAALVAPPVVFLGVYIAAWHATRHIGVVLHDSGSMPSRGRARLLRWAALPAAVALGAAAALWLASTGAPLLGYLREEIWMLTALAVPHALVVRWLDVTRTPPAATHHPVRTHRPSAQEHP